MSNSTLNISAQELHNEFLRILLSLNFTQSKAESCASIFTENTVDGVFSHGILRFPRFVSYIKKGYIDVDAEPSQISALGALEQWDGNLGPGPLNALKAAERAMQLADEYGIGCVALGNTNHWMRGGTYGWHAAKAGYAYMGWTNTEPNMPAWGAQDSRLGNNPVVLALPYKQEAIVLDMAMTQFSYGKLEDYKVHDKELPIAGGFDRQGNLTKQPGDILESMRALSIGYWKGAGLSLLLDLLVGTLSGGAMTHEINDRPDEYGVSQLFVAFSLKSSSHSERIQQQLLQAIAFYKQSVPADSESEVLYPGERVLRARKKHTSQGIPITQEVWDQLRRL